MPETLLILGCGTTNPPYVVWPRHSFSITKYIYRAKMDTLSPDDRKLFEDTLPTYKPLDLIVANRLRHWNVNHLPDAGGITDLHVSSIIGNALATAEHIVHRKEQIKDDRFKLNTWSLFRMKSIFVALAKKHGLTLAAGNDIHTFTDVRHAISEGFSTNNFVNEIKEIQVGFWRRVPYQDILENEYMLHHNIVYIPVALEDATRVRKHCIAKHIRVKYSDLCRDIKRSCQKAAGSYLVGQTRRSNAAPSAPTQICYVACRQNHLPLNNLTNHTNTARGENPVCAGMCDEAKHLRDDLAVEIQNSNELVIRHLSKIKVSILLSIYLFKYIQNLVRSDTY
jgi:hypothetical protein